MPPIPSILKYVIKGRFFLSVLKNLVGQTFSNWYVLKRDIEGEMFKKEEAHKRGKKYTHTLWLCKCVWGNKKSIISDSLIYGRSKSCGCCGITGFKDLTNKTFYDLIVLYRDIEREKKERTLKGVSRTYWVCKCVCDNLVSVESYTLINGNQKHCGCKRIDDLTGKCFGYLCVISRDIQKESEMKKNSKNIRTYWKCKCICGTIKGAHLVSGGVKSCGCIVSYGEKRIKELLNKANIKYKHNTSIIEVKSSKGNVLKFDFIVFKDSKIDYIIEFDGEQHFGYTGRDWSTKQHFENCRENDLIKNKYCFNNNIALIRIPYTDLKIMTLKDLNPNISSYILTLENEKLYYSKYEKLTK